MSGRCKVKINGTMVELSKDSSSFIDKGVIHQAINSFNQPVYILEVQQGEILEETDIVRIPTWEILKSWYVNGYIQTKDLYPEDCIVI